MFIISSVHYSLYFVLLYSTGIKMSGHVSTLLVLKCLIINISTSLVSETIMTFELLKIELKFMLRWSIFAIYYGVYICRMLAVFNACERLSL